MPGAAKLPLTSTIGRLSPMASDFHGSTQDAEAFPCLLHASRPEGITVP